MADTSSQSDAHKTLVGAPAPSDNRREKLPKVNNANARHDNTPSAYGQALSASCCDCGSCCPDCRACACADNARCNVARSCGRGPGRASEDEAAEQCFLQHGGA